MRTVFYVIAALALLPLALQGVLALLIVVGVVVGGR